MSMNLNLRVDGVYVSLWQTPTQITNMCVVQKDGQLLTHLKGQKAKHAIYIYMEWVKGSLNGVYDTIDDLTYAEEHVNKHIGVLEQLLFTARKILVYVS